MVGVVSSDGVEEPTKSAVELGCEENVMKNNNNDNNDNNENKDETINGSPDEMREKKRKSVEMDESAVVEALTNGKHSEEEEKEEEERKGEEKTTRVCSGGGEDDGGSVDAIKVHEEKRHRTEEALGNSSNGASGMAAIVCESIQQQEEKKSTTTDDDDKIGGVATESNNNTTTTAAAARMNGITTTHSCDDAEKTRATKQDEISTTATEQKDSSGKEDDSNSSSNGKMKKEEEEEEEDSEETNTTAAAAASSSSTNNHNEEQALEPRRKLPRRIDILLGDTERPTVDPDLIDEVCKIRCVAEGCTGLTRSWLENRPSLSDTMMAEYTKPKNGRGRPKKVLLLPEEEEDKGVNDNNSNENKKKKRDEDDSNSGGGAGGGGSSMFSGEGNRLKALAEAIRTQIVLFCSTCRDMYHPSCIDAAEYIPADLRDSWQCPNCLVCTVCKGGGKEESMLQCDRCDRGFHMFCLKPPLKRLPDSKWYCDRCVVCLSCGSKSPGEGDAKWFMGMTMCTTCYRRHGKGNICTLCNLVWTTQERETLYFCKSCSNFQHPDCVEASWPSNAERSPTREKYRCVKCIEKRKMKELMKEKKAQIQSNPQQQQQQKQQKLLADVQLPAYYFPSQQQSSQAPATPSKSSSSPAAAAAASSSSISLSVHIPRSPSTSTTSSVSPSFKHAPIQLSMNSNSSSSSVGQDVLGSSSVKRRKLPVNQPIDLQYLIAANFRFRFTDPIPPEMRRRACTTRYLNIYNSAWEDPPPNAPPSLMYNHGKPPRPRSAHSSNSNNHLHHHHRSDEAGGSVEHSMRATPRSESKRPRSSGAAGGNASASAAGGEKTDETEQRDEKMDDVEEAEYFDPTLRAYGCEIVEPYTGLYPRSSEIERIEICLQCGAPGARMDMLFCSDCGEAYHPFCVYNKFVLSLSSRQAQNWRCPQCKFCSTCGKIRQDKDTMMTCFECDRVFHGMCLSPPIKYPQDEQWACEACVRCHYCGKKSDSGWKLGLSMCTSCSDKKKQNHYCPMCKELYAGNNYNVQMIQCDDCKMWIHAECEGLGDVAYRRIEYFTTFKYICTPCRMKSDHGIIPLYSSMTDPVVQHAIRTVLHSELGGDRERFVFPVDEEVKVIPPELLVIVDIEKIAQKLIYYRTFYEFVVDYIQCIVAFGEKMRNKSDLSAGVIRGLAPLSAHISVTELVDIIEYAESQEEQYGEMVRSEQQRRAALRDQRKDRRFLTPPLVVAAATGGSGNSSPAAFSQTQQQQQQVLNDNSSNSGFSTETVKMETTNPVVVKVETGVVGDEIPPPPAPHCGFSLQVEDTPMSDVGQIVISAAAAAAAATSSVVSNNNNNDQPVDEIGQSCSDLCKMEDDEHNFHEFCSMDTTTLSSQLPSPSHYSAEDAVPQFMSALSPWIGSSAASCFHEHHHHHNHNHNHQHSRTKGDQFKGFQSAFLDRRPIRKFAAEKARKLFITPSEILHAPPPPPPPVVVDSEGKKVYNPCASCNTRELPLQWGEILELRRQGLLVSSLSASDSVPMQNVACFLCGVTGANALEGRLVHCGSNRWVHSNCYIWSSGVRASDKAVIIDHSNMFTKADTSICTRCFRSGATLCCDRPGCTYRAHFSCALLSFCVFLPSLRIRCPIHAIGNGTAAASKRAHLSIHVTGLKPYRVPQPGNPPPRVLATVDKRVHSEVMGQARLYQKIADTVVNGENVLRSGALTIVSTGEIMFNRNGFSNVEHLYPLGYKSCRWHWRRVSDARERTLYWCEISDGEEGPLFRVWADNAPTSIVEASTPDDAWALATGHKYSPRPILPPGVLPTSPVIDGAYFFGITTAGGLPLLEAMSGAQCCLAYTPRFDLWRGRDVDLHFNTSGCARCEGYADINRKSFRYRTYRHSMLPPPPQPVQEEQTTRIDDSHKLSLPMRLRNMRQHPRSEIKRSLIHEHGLFATRQIREGEMIIEYCGELVSNRVADAREADYERRGVGCYMFRITEDTVVDATVKGNSARFINHSCEPNCFAEIVAAEGTHAIVIFAGRLINQGEELTYDYKMPIEDVKIPCHCGSARCRRYLN